MGWISERRDALKAAALQKPWIYFIAAVSFLFFVIGVLSEFEMIQKIWSYLPPSIWLLIIILTICWTLLEQIVKLNKEMTQTPLFSFQEFLRRRILEGKNIQILQGASLTFEFIKWRECIRKGIATVLGADETRRFLKESNPDINVIHPNTDDTDLTPMANTVRHLNRYIFELKSSVTGNQLIGNYNPLDLQNVEYEYEKREFASSPPHRS